MVHQFYNIINVTGLIINRLSVRQAIYITYIIVTMLLHESFQLLFTDDRTDDRNRNIMQNFVYMYTNAV